MLTVAAAQIRSGPDPDRNLDKVREMTHRAAEHRADLVVFPEATMACFGSPLRSLAQPLDGPFADGVREIARHHSMLVSVGMFTPADDGRAHNTTLITDGAGTEHRYDKVHLFDALGAQESRTIAPGTRWLTFEWLGATFGVATCYDIRFADQFTALGRSGVDVILVGASWADGPRKADQWRTLVKARAMDAQAFIVAADQALTPTDNGEPLGVGVSAVAHPAGHLVDELGDDEDLLVARIDTEDVAALRERLPVLGINLG